MSHFAIINTYEKIDTLNYKLTGILENIDTNIDSQRLDFDEVIDKIFSICWNKLNYLFFELPTDFCYCPDFYQYLKQHLIIASTYTIQHLCNSKEQHANDYIYKLIAHQLVGVSKQNEQRKIYEFLSESLDTWSGQLLDLSKDINKNKSSITTATSLPLFLTQLYQDIHLRDSRIVYKPYKKTKTSNATGHSNRHFHNYLDNLNYIKYNLINYDTIKNDPVEQVLYYYKHERAYGLNFLNDILLRMENEIIQFYISTRYQKGFDNQKHTSYSYELCYTTEYLLLLQYLPNVFSRANMLEDFESMHPVTLRDFINITLPTYENLFFYLLLNYSNTQDLTVIYRHLKKYIEAKLDPTNAAFPIWKNIVYALRETKNNHLYDIYTKPSSSLDIQYKRMISNIASAIKPTKDLLQIPKTTLEFYFQNRYRPSWWGSIPKL